MIKTLGVLALLLLTACSKTDPILPGVRSPVFRQDEPTIIDRVPTDLGQPLKVKDCAGITLNSNNEIWHGNNRIFAGLPTESEIATPRRVACRGEYVYAGLSTGELIKVNRDTRDLEWTVDIFAENIPLGGSPFLDIIASPVVNGGYIYAGGLGNAFCKVRDTDGKKIWCVPISVQSIECSTTKFNFVLSTDNKSFAIENTNGTIYKMSRETPCQK